MNETVLDVLMYLFENFSDTEYEHTPDQVVLRDELLQAGFGELEVDRALDCLETAFDTGGYGLRDWFEHDSDLDPIRDHPRFQELIARTR